MGGSALESKGIRKSCAGSIAYVKVAEVLQSARTVARSEAMTPPASQNLYISIIKFVV